MYRNRGFSMMALGLLGALGALSSAAPAVALDDALNAPDTTPRKHRRTSKYMPHQGEREKARRLRRMVASAPQ